MHINDKKRKVILLISNFILIIAVIIAAGLYSKNIYGEQEESKRTAFIRTVESMKQVSQNYLDRERGYVRDWASYISKNDMDMEEALDFLRNINTDDERFAHIVDMSTYQAYSSYYPEGEEEIDTYSQYVDNPDVAEASFGEIMEGMYDGSNDEYAILGKYRLKETKAMAIGVGTKVTLQTGEGSRDYLLLRIIPVEVIKKYWVFPMEYSSAEIGIITSSGDYVVQSPSMKSQNFAEYIRGYNFQDDYNKVDELREKLENTESGTLNYKNFRDRDCLWYYSSFGENSSLDIVGMIEQDELKGAVDAWYLVLIVGGTLVLLMFIDGAYLISINHRLRETARASEQASKAKTQFLSAMSHDIRTPLNAVLGMMNIAQRKSYDSDYVKSCMEKGMHSGRFLLTLVNDILDISKIESGKVRLNLERVSLNDIIQDLTDMNTSDYKDKNIKIDYDFDNLPYRYVYADRMRLNQIYVNLLSNALKYTGNDGRILVRLYQEAARKNTAATRLVFFIQDNGIGMTEEFQKNMYSTFEREVKTQVNTTQGTGLGLAIVKQMVDLMGGTIECQSSPGEGTTFTVKIDLTIMDAEEKKEKNVQADVDISGMHLLIAEDNELNWEIIKELLDDRGITCDRAENGLVCLEKLKKTPVGTYDAVLMDIQMPVMNGYEATREIRVLKDDRLNKIPILAMTADAFAEDVQACIECGMDGHIAKPVDMDKLVSYLQNIKRNTL